MKKVMTLEIWVDEKLEDAAECVSDVYDHVIWHELIRDGSVTIKVVDKDRTIIAK